ncbi:unnamed protein product [Arabidopsis thaliana]|uniref:(thale cress) hypothetical protein n=1 Tax=Arabidopsis thaliana TaxID=3702 RepID=A0A7G2DVB6_ARATH|nr:unnamed protein product [Arabidopsis thaliana]
MNSDSNKSSSNGFEKSLTPEETLLGPLTEKSSEFCSDAAITRYLAARNGHVKKATKMLKETLKWRAQYKPEEIRWEEIAREAETGKIYRANCTDKYGRTVLVMRPSCQNTKSYKGQIRILVYCMENAILNLPDNQEQMVWLIDFHGFNMSHISLKVSRETAHVLQEHYPERLGLAIVYNPPKIFESFYKMVKPFLEPKTSNKVKFVYSDDNLSNKLLEDLFDMEQLEVAFGGKNSDAGFNFEKYAERMREDDLKFYGNTTVSSTSAHLTNSDSEVSDSEMKYLEDKEDEPIENGTLQSPLDTTKT